MADYKHTGFDPVYGYCEEIQYKSYQKQCAPEYTEKYDNDPVLDEEHEKICSQPNYIEEKNLTLPKCKCERH